MNTPTLAIKIAALFGRPIAVSTRPAAFDDTGGIRIAADRRDQLPRARGLRSRNGVEYARRTRPDGSLRWLRLDLVRPEAAGPLPLVVYLPGGGFVRAIRLGGRRLRRRVAEAGYVVASVEYRTTMDAATYVDGMSDVRAAIDHLRRHADEYGIDPGRIALWGESAGGYLAAMVGVGADGTDDPAILAVVDMFGASALDRVAEGFDDAMVAKVAEPGDSIARYAQGPDARHVDDDEARLRAADPVSHVSAAAPAFLLFHGSDDRIVSPVQTGILHRALRAAGADSTWCIVDGAGHGEIAVKPGEEKDWTTVPMMKRVTDFLERTVRERPLPSVPAGPVEP